MGIKPYTILLGILFACISLSVNLQAQNNLEVEYNGATGVPNFLNICGEPDTARMTISITGDNVVEIEPRENIQATLNLFQGAQFVELISSESSAGVSLISSGLNTATFSIPDLDPFILPEIDLVFALRADCSFIDTINANNQALVFDTWDLSYDLDGSSLTESEFTAEYKDAFAVPNLTISNMDDLSVSSVGECFDRSIVLSNSGLSGFIDSLHYETTYGPGITVNSVMINGIVYPLVKTPVGLDTMYEVTILGAFLEQNTLGTGLGDGDQSLDPDESLIITENICVLSCAADRSSVHNVSWGCYGAACEVETLNNFVTIGSGAPNPVQINMGSIPNETTGYCKDGAQSITFTNSGNEVDLGYGTMRDVELGIGLGNDFLLDVDKYEIFSVTVAGITLFTTDSLIKLDQFAEFAVPPLDPSGTNGPDGLIDWDGDGFYDDLPLNASVEISVGYRFVCSEANSTDDNCENLAAVSLASRIIYSNSCAERLSLDNNSIIRPSNIAPDSESSTDTDAVIAADTFRVEYFQLRAVSNFDKACSGGERMIVTVDLPQGISVVLDETQLFRNTSIMLPLVSSSLNGTVMELVYDASVSNFISGEFTISLGLSSDCTTLPGATSFPVTLAHYCPDCDCTHTWFCGDLDGPILHPNEDVCNNVPPCPNGIRALDFDVSRTTFGYTDETYTQKVDPDDVNQKVALSCDSVMMTVESVVGDDIITNDVGVIITYDNPEELPGTDEIFLFDGGEVEIRQVNGNVDFCTVAASAITVTTTGINKRLDIELDDCLATLGVTLSPNDTIVFKGMFSLNPDTDVYNEQFKLVPNFRGEMYHTFAGDQLSCDNYGETFTVAKTGSLFVTPSSPSFPRGCRETDLNYSVAVFNNDFGVFYPNEFIPAAFTDSIKFSFEPAILDAFEDLSVEVSIPNHPIYGNDYFEIPGLDAFPNGEYVATFDTLVSIPSYNTSFSAVFNLRVNLVANCGSETASADGDNVFDFEPTIYYRDRIYAESYGDGSCAEYVEESVGNDIIYTQAPTFLFQSDNLANQQVMGNEVQWLIRHCNTSTASDAGLNWLALDIPNQSVNIESIQDISTGTPVDVPFTSYGNNNSVFAYVDPLLRNFSANDPADICNIYIVTGSFNECGTFPLVARAGWNCTPYDEPDWTPLDYAPCNEDTINLSVTTLEGALDAEVILQPGDNGEMPMVDLCDTLTYEILVRNTELGDIFEMENQFFLPLGGLEFVPNSFELAYPPSSPFVPINNPTLEGVTSRGELHVFNDFSDISPFLEANGLQGFSPSMPVDSNEYVIRFQLVSTCNFVSGDQLSYSFQGVSACGDSTNIEFGETLPIFVQEIPEASQFFLAEFGAASNYDITGNGTLDISISPFPGTPSDDNDVVRVILPPNTTYTPNSILVNTPVTWTPGEPEIIIENGFTILYWDLPPGVTQDEPISFSFDFTGNPIPECSTDTLDFNLFTLDRYDTECGVTNEICTTFVGTTEGGEQVLDIIVTNGISINVNNAISACVDDNTEEVTVTAEVNGLPTLTQDATVMFYFDADMNGVPDPIMDVLLSTSTIPAGVTNDFTVNEIFNVTNDQLCNLIMVVEVSLVDLGNCGQPAPVVISPTLQNAGVSTNYCGTPLTIGDDGCGNISTYTYQWSAVAPATNADISDLNILNPILTVDPSIPEGTVLQYILETTRDGCGYASTDTIEITVLPNLTVDITPDGSTVVCEGETLLLTANASETVSYQWSDGTGSLGSNPTLTVAPTTATTYTVVVTNNSGCSAMTTIDITIGTGVTTIDAGNNATICLGSSIQLQGSATGGNGTLFYSWTGAGLDNSNIANPIATPAVTTTYTLEVTDEDGCTQSDDVIITVDPDVPTVVADDATICVGQTTILNASGGNNYTWTEMPGNPSANTLSAANIATPIFTPTVEGTYNFEVSVAGGCDNVTVPVAVEVTSIQVTITPDGSTTVCEGESLLLTANTTGTVSHQWSDGTSNLGTNPTLTVSPTAAITYSVVVTDNDGCTAMASIDITTVAGVTAIDAGNPETICLGSSIQLQGSATGGNGVLSYSWTGAGLDDSNVANPTATPTVTTTYTLEVTDEDGCTQSDDVIITVDPDVPTVVADDATICVGLTTVLNASGGDNYAWTEMPGNPSTNTLSATNIATPTFTPTTEGTYTFEVLVAGGCDDITVPVTVEVTSIQIVTPQVDLDQCDGDVQAVSIILEENIQSYTINGAPFMNDAANGATLTFDAMYVQGINSYTIELEGISGCIATTTFDFLECPCNPAIIQGVLVANSNCGESVGSVTINISGNPADYTFDWLPNIGTSTGNGESRGDLPAGTYEVDIEEIANPGCIVSTTVVIGNSDGPAVTSIVTTPATCNNNDGTATLLPVDWTYDWSDTGTGNVRTDLAAGIYGVTVTDPEDNSCTNVITVIILEDNDLIVSHNVITDPTCGNNDGSVEVVVAGGGVYTFIWSDGGTGAIRNDLASGTYVINIQEVGGEECSTSYILALTDSDVPQAPVIINEVVDVLCVGDANGAVDFTVTIPAGIANPVDTIITDGFTEWTNGSLSAGLYCIEIRDANGCVNGAACFEIEAPEPILANISTTAACGEGGSVTINTIGGTGIYTYDWADIVGTNNPKDRTNLTAGNYELFISDSNGCQMMLDGGITIPECPCSIEPEIESVVIVEAHCGEADGEATIIVNPATAGLDYTWFPDLGTSVGDGNTRTGLLAGGYTVTVSDLSGECFDVVTFAVNNEDGPELDGPIATTFADCGTANGTATLSPPSFNYAWSDGGMGSTRTDLEAGTYFVSISEPGNTTCFSVEEVFIGQNNDLEVTVNTVTAPNCGNADGTIMATTNGSGTYSYEWSFGGMTDNTQENIMAGVYGVTATDTASPDCEATTTFVVVDGDVVGADVVINSVTNVSCGGESDGMVDFIVTPQAGFQGPETVVIANDNGEFVNGTLAGGDYCIVVYDANGCVAGGDCFTIEENEPLDAEFSISGGCGSDGAIDITITEGTGTYNFDWADLPGTNDPEDRDDLETGIYNVTITDANGCTISGLELEINCDECTLDLDLESVVVQEASCGENDGEAVVNANVDLGALVFTWTPNLGTPGVTGNIRTNLPAGEYIVEAVDTTGLCTDMISFVITNEDAPELDGEPIITPTDCASANGSVTLSPDTYDYVWSHDNGTGAVRTDLAAGIYFVSFSDTTAPNCGGIIEVIVPTNNTLEVTIDIANEPTCGNADGEISANVTNGSGNYAYVWSTGGTTMSQTGLMSGTYSVEVTDMDNLECTATATVVLVDSDVATNFDVVINTITNVSCAGAADGSVDFDVTPNTGFTTTIVGNGTTYANGNLPGGDYCINVIDASGCIAGEGCFTILESELLEVEFSISEGCQDAGSIDLIITGGTGGYTFDWADLPGADDPEDRTDLEVGIYSVSISDENGCVLEGLDLEVLCTDCDFEPMVTSTVIYEATCGNSDGEVIINVNVDQSLPVYTWSPDVGTPGLTGNIRTDLPAGGYTVTVADPTGNCFDVVTFAVTNEDGPDLEADPVTTPADCDDNNGTATLLPAAYDYTWFDGNQNNERTDLATGVYFVTFTDPASPDCESIVEIAIGTNSTLEVEIEVVTAPTCGNADGEITANVTNGSGNYQYIWNFGGNTMTANNLESGSYIVMVTDMDNPDCTASASVVLTDSDVTNVDITIDEVTNITCQGESNGLVAFTANIPAGFNTIITDGIDIYDNGSLPAGELCIEITDANNCVAGGACFVVEEPTALDVEFSISGGCAQDGAINIIANGGTGNYTFDWADLPGTDDPEDRTDLTIGTYSVSVSDENGCVLEGLDLEVLCSEDCDIEPEVVSTVIYEATCGNLDGEVIINLNVDPSLPVYTWQPNLGTPGATGNIRTGLPAGGYTVIVADSTGACFDTVTFAITNEDGPDLENDPVTTAADCNDNNGTATLLPDSYEYLWFDGNTNNERTDLAAGVYFVTFTDPANPNCESIVEVTIGTNSTLDVEIEVVNAPTCGNADGEITANVTNGSGNYEYAWSFGGNSMTGINLESGSYVVTVTDMDNPDCISSASIVLIDSDVTNVDVTINDITNITCEGEVDGFVDFTANIPAGFNTVITDGINVYDNGSLPAGELCIEVTDANDCVAGGACFVIEEPMALDVEFSISGGCAEDGGINIIANGGTGNYIFDWADLPGTDDPEDRTDLEEGLYSVTISDENGCTLEGLDLEVVCTECDFEPEVISTVIYEATCGNSDGEVTINLNVDPSLPVYTWSPDVGTPGVTGNIRTDLPAGGYTVTVADSTGNCFDTVTFAVTNEDGPDLDEDPIIASADCDDNNGTATLLPDSYEYLWFDGNMNNERTDLAAGVYFVTFTDPANPDCESIVEVTIGTNSTLDVEIEVVNAPTCGNADGEITANVTNGSGNYQYVWSFGGSSMTESGLESGSYVVTVTDMDNPDCTALASVTLIDSDVTNIDVTINELMNITCQGEENGLVVFTANVPTGFNTVITDGVNVYENGSLPAGELCVEITDANGCVAGGACFVIEEPTALDVEFSISGGCAEDGAINIIANGGTGDYTFDWLDLPGDNNVEDRTNLSTGVYSVIVSDGNECSVVGLDLAIECDECEDPIIDYTVAFESVCGGFIGSAEVVVNGNTTGYSYDWTPSDVGTVSEDGNKLTQLPAGLYQVVVTDTTNSACIDSVSILVTNEDGPEATIELITPAGCGLSDGTATLAPDSLIYEWSDGGMGAVRDDLAAGTYEVIYYDDEDTTCYNALLVEIPDTANLELEVEIVSLPDCNMNNGQVNINLVSGMGQLSFIWSDGGNGQTRDDLESGTYTVIALDEASGCSTEITFTLLDNVPETATINITAVNNIACNGDGLGSVVFDVTYDNAFEQPAVITVTDGFTAYDNANLPVGNYCINVEDAEGCLVASECFEITETEELELSITGTYAGCEGTGELGSLDVTVTGGTTPYTFDWGDLDDPNEPEDRSDLEAGMYDLTVTDALGCMIVADGIQLDTFCITDCDYFDGMDTLVIEIMCGDTLQVCTNLSYADFLLGEYTISLDGEPYDITVEDVCESETLVGYNTLILPNQGNVGPYFVDAWEVDGVIYSGEYMTTMDLIDSMNTWNPGGNWMLGQQGAFIVGGITGVSYGDLTIYVVGNPVLSATLTTNSIASSNNIGVDITEEGQHEIVIANNETLCQDTLIVNVGCMEYTLYDTITLGDSIYFCLDVMELIDSTDLMGNIVSLENACPDSSGTSVIFNIESEVPPCISYLGITPGTDMACLVLCDDMGICDTVNYVVTVVPTGPLVVMDTILIMEQDTFCLDSLTDLCGDIVSVTDYCNDGSMIVDFDIIETDDDVCITYTGLNLGVDSACLEVIDEYGNADTVIIIIDVVPTTPDTICDTIFIGQVVEYCIENAELLTDPETLENLCPEESGEFVEFFADPTTYCVTYEGVEDVGTDSACVVICDSLGICDTTYFCITVVEFFDPPIAVDDIDTTMTNVPIVINVKENDTIYGGIDSIYVIDGPLAGEVTLNLDCTITYTPDEGVCSVTDSFTYVVCNPNACDTATVFIYIECTELTIFNGFTPNNDGVNDVFYIDGIEDFPNNRLCIYNRWGNKVYDKKGYNNEWFGTWSGNDLPDGTYYYVLDLGDEDNTIYNGYIQIHR